MDDKEKNQKTVVAFVAGLLIGGLLVWVFSASPDDREMSDNDMADDDSAIVDGDTNTEDTSPAQGAEGSTSEGSGSAPDRVSVSGNGSIAVADQAAGGVVLLGEISYPTNDGWIVVHDDVNGELGNALGASRYSVEVGLVPTTVELLRSTEAGKTYHAVLYSENGDRVFDLNEDRPLESGGNMISSAFSAN